MRILIACALSLLANVATADPLRLQATSTWAPLTDPEDVQRFQVSDFWIDFEDTGNGLLDFNEIVSFSGLVTTVRPENDITAVSFIPTIDGFANTNGSPSNWHFNNQRQNYGMWIGPSLWSYQITQAPVAAVPEPSTLLLVLAGLASIGVSLRRRTMKRG